MQLNTAEIEKLHKEIEEKRRQIIQLRRAQKPEKIKNYSFTDREGKTKELLDLFEDKNELLVVHNMGKSCVYCTMWADGFRGYAQIISDKMPWVLTSPDDIETLKEFSSSRNWNFEVLSFHKSTFAHDLGFAYEKNDKTWYWPGVSALIKKEGEIFRVAKESFGPGDMFNPVWHFFDLFPKDNNPWQPKYNY